MNEQQIERLDKDRTGVSRWDAAAFRVLAVIALLGGAAALWWGGGNAVNAAVHGSAPIELDLISPQPIAVADPDALPARADSVTVLVSGVGDTARALLTTGAVVGAIVGAIVAVAIALFLWRLAQGKPFHRSLFGSTLLAGAAMAVGGLLAAFTSGIGAMEVARELDPDGEVFVAGFTFDPFGVVTGVVVLALAFAFRAGTRLQRETEGLV